MLGSVSPGEYRIQMAPPSPEMYLKEATFDRTDVLNRPWEITNQTSGTLNIVFSNKGGQIEGSLVDAQSQPVRGSQVILIPDQDRDRPELYKTATTDQNGRFTLRGIAPGGYRAYAWKLSKRMPGTIAKSLLNLKRKVSRSASRNPQKKRRT